MPDAAGFEAFYRENLDRIVRACCLVTLDRGASEDIASEAFVRLWARWGQIRGPDHAGGFVFKTAMRLCSKELRRRSSTRRWDPVTRTDEVERLVDRHIVFTALSDLSVRQRQAVVLRDWAGFESGEVARMLGMKESTLRVHLARAREHLREVLSVNEEAGS